MRGNSNNKIKTNDSQENEGPSTLFEPRKEGKKYKIGEIKVKKFPIVSKSELVNIVMKYVFFPSFCSEMKEMTVTFFQNSDFSK